jgi:ABC-type lipoprotein release transport system permease subunit
MGAVWIRFRSDLRRRALALVLLGVLTGIAGGVVIAAAAGARRTDSTLSRYVRDGAIADVLLNPDSGANPHWAEVDDLPHVTDVGSLAGVAALKLDHGQIDKQFFSNLLAAAGDTHLYHSIQREKVVDGRMPNPAARDEVAVNERMARTQHLRVGSHFQLQVFTQAEADRLMQNQRAEGRPARFVVTGIVAPLDDVTRAADDPRFSGAMLFTPAFLHHGDVGVLFVGKYVRLEHGARDLPAFERAARTALQSDVNFQERTSTETRVDRAVRPYVFALWAFAILAAVVGGLVVAQTVARQHRADARDDPTLRALGFSRRDLALNGALRGAVIGSVAVVVALVVAYFASTLMPIGPLRPLEPRSGRQVDGTVFALGGLLILCFAIVHGAAMAVMAPVVRRPRRHRDVPVSMPAPVTTGFRFAFDRGQGRSAMPLRSTLLGVTLAVAALVASVTYAGAMSHFTSTPRLYGWVWNYQVEADDETPAVGEAIETALANTEGITYTRGAYAQLDFGKESVAAIAVAPKAGMSTVDVVRGRGPAADDEVVLGAKTMHSLDVGIGDRVRVAGNGRSYSMRVVGQAVFARFAPYSGSDSTGLGTGAALTLHALRQFDLSEAVGVGSPFFLVDVQPGAHVDAATLRRQLFHDDPSAGNVYGAQRPNDVLSYQHLRNTPLLLAALLVLLGAATTAHLLVTGVRRRRRDLGLLKAIGCTIKQLLSIVLVQATTLIAITLIVAIPAGIVTGRFAWTVTAHWLGVPAATVVPIGVVVAVVGFALLAGNLVAFGPGLSAGRVRPAVALRSE